MSDRLVTKRLARRQRTASDRRSVRVSATTAGRALVDQVTERRRGDVGRIVAAMTPERRAAPEVARAARGFAEAAGEVPDQDWTTGWDSR